ncbi:MAG TPA: sulfotransferase [Gemmataceae bacterium]|nr:sulfotransferase [Gemmataceae bacterium]
MSVENEMDPAGTPKTPIFSPRMWVGCDLFAWLRLLWFGRYRFGWKQFRILPIGTVLTTIHTFLRYAQEGLYGDQIRRTQIVEPPIFILGHWRSGTTLLHELLVQDPRHAFPNTCQCFDPCHSLLTERLIRRYFNWLLPPRRIMDNMPVGWERPQEDEFALALMGQPSPYWSIAFPWRGPMDKRAMDLDGLPARTRTAWKRAFLHFLQTVTLRAQRRLVLKSPPHTCRIPTLLEMFPDARFVHIVRDPFAVYSSTLNLWKRLYGAQALHTPSYEGLEESVFAMFRHFHERLDATRHLVAPERFFELRYEELTKDPVAELRRLYVQLDLGSFENLRPNLERYLAENERYEKNRFELSETERTEVLRQWGDVIRKYGYP